MVPDSILLICINYGNPAETVEFLRGIFQQAQADRIRCIVVENTPGCLVAPLEGRIASAGLPGDKIRVVGDGMNRGYFGGMHYGYCMASEMFLGTTPKWIVLSNTDIELRSQDFFGQLMQCADAPHVRERIAVVAPRIVSSLTGTEQNPCYESKPHKCKLLLLCMLFRFYPVAALHRLAATIWRKMKPAVPKKNLSAAREIFGAHGSFLIINCEYFKRGGTLRYPCFLFCEELFLAEQVRTLNMRVLFEPKLEVIHREHATTGVLPSRFIAKCLYQAHKYCLSTYY